MQEPLISESSKGTYESTWACITCGQEAHENFCAHCGEKRHDNHDFSLKHVLAEAAEAFFHVDSKIFRTLKTLVTTPGKLAGKELDPGPVAHAGGCSGNSQLWPKALFFRAHHILFARIRLVVAVAAGQPRDPCVSRGAPSHCRTAL